MTLPLLISLPHGGVEVPPEVKAVNLLDVREIVKDGDEGANEVYNIQSDVLQFVTTPVARAFVDMNRPESDRSADGVVKTHTCWNVPVYSTPLTESTVAALLESYYRPYHRQLSSPQKGAILGLDCHTMAAIGPPIGPMAGQERPAICISNADGTCPDKWINMMAECLEEEFRRPVSINFPFKGGYIIRTHSDQLPWLQLELSRAPFMPLTQKRSSLLRALTRWCELIG